MVGGVRAGATDLLDDSGKQFRLGHWARVEESSGLPFNRAAFLACKNFVYDTEPICRAVVTARQIALQADHSAVFRALQHAFYVDALDTTDGAVLAQIAITALGKQGHVHQEAMVYDLWLAPGTIFATNAEFASVRAMGIRSFPALLLDVNGRMTVIKPGALYQRLKRPKFRQTYGRSIQRIGTRR